VKSGEDFVSIDGEDYEFPRATIMNGPETPTLREGRMSLESGSGSPKARKTVLMSKFTAGSASRISKTRSSLPNTVKFNTNALIVTLNPNTKDLTQFKEFFRPVDLVLPDYAPIIKNMLHCDGILHASQMLVDKCIGAEQESVSGPITERHDLGLRAFKAMIERAGINKRQSPKLSDT